MPYLVMIHATFASKADADHIYDQAMAVSAVLAAAGYSERPRGRVGGS